MDLLRDTETAEAPPDYVLRAGQVFTRFDVPTADSGNVSYGVTVGGERFFVKTPGEPSDTAFLAHSQRIAALRNAADLASSCSHSALAPLRNVVESPSGPMLVFDWFAGDTLGGPEVVRAAPASAHQRFRRLEEVRIAKALEHVFQLHAILAASGWIAVDFYDGSLMYDFDRAQVRVVDLDLYRRAPFTNTMGRMFGSPRFMAPEEFERGAVIDQRTTVFALRRCAAVFLGDGTRTRATFRGTDAQHDVVCRASHARPAERFETVAEFADAWTHARI